MRWIQEPYPKLGSLRIETRFLWLPLGLWRSDGSRCWRWLEFADVMEEYSVRGNSYKWRPKKFHDFEDAK